MKKKHAAAFKTGELITVSKGFIDPIWEKFDMSNWYGKIINVLKGDKPEEMLYDVRWSDKTMVGIPDEYFELCEKEGYPAGTFEFTEEELNSFVSAHAQKWREQMLNKIKALKLSIKEYKRELKELQDEGIDEDDMPEEHFDEDGDEDEDMFEEDSSADDMPLDEEEEKKEEEETNSNETAEEVIARYEPKFIAAIGEGAKQGSLENLQKYFNYLQTQISYPCYLTGIFAFEWEDKLWEKNNYPQIEKLRQTNASHWDVLKLNKIELKKDAILGHMTRVTDKKAFVLPLHLWEPKDKTSSNYDVLDTYSVWYIYYVYNPKMSALLKNNNSL